MEHVPDVNMSLVVVRGMLFGFVGLCTLTVGGINLLLLPGEPNVWLLLVLLVTAGTLIGFAARDARHLINS